MDRHGSKLGLRNLSRRNSCIFIFNVKILNVCLLHLLWFLNMFLSNLNQYENKACEDATSIQYIKPGLKRNKANYLYSRSTEWAEVISGHNWGCRFKIVAISVFEIWARRRTSFSYVIFIHCKDTYTHMQHRWEKCTPFRFI